MRGVLLAIGMVVGLAGAAAGQEMPADQRRFLELLTEHAEAYRRAPNDMARGATRPARARALCAMLKTMAVRGWVGTIETLSSTSDGRGVLEVRLADHASLATWNNGFSDQGDRTLIPAGSALFQQAVQLQRRQKVVFEGRFIPHRDDCVREKSLTVDGGMRDPSFLFRFTAVRPAR